MRFETHRVSEYLVRLLQWSTPVREVTIDGGDIVEFNLHSGETVRLYLIESALPLYEIQGIVEGNNAAGVHTLFLLWCDLLLPAHGRGCRLEDWSAALLELSGGQIYAYDIDGPDIYLFPVYFDGQGAERVARYGPTVDLNTLGAGVVGTDSAYFRAGVRMAGFARAAARQAFLSAEYARLELEPGAPAPAVKRAYRRLALRYHPDRNQDPGAHDQMLALNRAYRRILDALDGDHQLTAE